MTATVYTRAYRCDECKTHHCECRYRTPDEQRAWVLAEGWEDRWEVTSYQQRLKDRYLAGEDPTVLASGEYFV